MEGAYLGEFYETVLIDQNEPVSTMPLGRGLGRPSRLIQVGVPP